jgi:PAS domain S-box-containing protein
MEHEESLDREDALEIVRNLPEIIYKIDEQGNFIFINDAVTQLGWMPEELIGQHYSVLIHADDIEKVTRSSYIGKTTGDKRAPQLFDERRTGERRTKHLEIRLLRKNDGTRNGLLEVSASGHYVPSVTSKHKIFKGTIGVIRDVSERKRLEEKIRNTQNLNTFRDLGEAISHDFGNVLQRIKSNIQLAQIAQDKSDLKRYLESADAGADILHNLINKYRFKQSQATQKSRVDVYLVAQNVLKILDSPAYQCIDKIIDLGENEFNVYADKSDIEEILLNIVANSLESIDLQKKGHVKISAENYSAGMYDDKMLPKGNYVHIIVEDTGIGMSKETKDRAFDPSFTTKPRNTKQAQGLGLSIAYAIIMKYEGHIEMESFEGEGTKCHVYMPKWEH